MRHLREATLDKHSHSKAHREESEGMTMTIANAIMLGIVALFVLGPVLRAGLQWMLGTKGQD
jgi:hypothetical protein